MKSLRPPRLFFPSFKLGLTFALFLTAKFSFAQNGNIETTVAQLEAQLNARIGVSVYDMENEEHFEYRGDDLFPLSSTFKTLACAALLHKVDSGLERLERVVVFDEDDLVSYSPITESYAGTTGMSLSDLCKATMSVSDNTAGNLILRSIGGPDGLTQFVRSIGDEVTQLNRWETELNEGLLGDRRDTTTPNAMASTLELLVLGKVLSVASRNQLEQWLLGNSVGDDLFRAGIPSGWKIGDKTGAGGYGSRSIAAIMWPPARKPIIATVYITQTEASFAEQNDAIAQIGQAIAAEVADK